MSGCGCPFTERGEGFGFVHAQVFNYVPIPQEIALVSVEELGTGRAWLGEDRGK